MVVRPWSSARLSCGERLLLRWDGNAGNSFPTSREKIRHLEVRGRNGAPLDVGRTLVLPLIGNGYVGEVLELQQGCEGPFGSSRGYVSLASIRLSRLCPHLAWRVKPPGFSRVLAGALDLRRGPQGPALVAYRKDGRVTRPCELLGGL